MEIKMEYEWKYKHKIPFNWMVNDLYRGMQVQQNYLVALGLLNYSEALGWIILNKKCEDGLVCFRKFTEQYMGYTFPEKDWYPIFNDLRNGLAHRYFIKNRLGGVINLPGSFSCGIEYDNDRIQVNINPYFYHFVAGVEKYLDALGKG